MPVLAGRAGGGSPAEPGVPSYQAHQQGGCAPHLRLWPASQNPLRPLTQQRDSSHPPCKLTSILIPFKFQNE